MSGKYGYLCREYTIKNIDEVKKNCLDEDKRDGKWFSKMSECKTEWEAQTCGALGTCCVPSTTTSFSLIDPECFPETDSDRGAGNEKQGIMKGLFDPGADDTEIETTKANCATVGGIWNEDDKDQSKCNAAKANNCGAGFPSSSSESSRSNVSSESSESSEDASSSSEEGGACCKRWGNETTPYACNAYTPEESDKAEEACSNPGEKWFSKMSDCESLGGNKRYVCAENQACCGLEYDFVGGDYSEKVSTGVYHCRGIPPIENNQDYVSYKNQCEGERYKGRFFGNMEDCEEALNKTDPIGKNCVSTKQLAN